MEYDSLAHLKDEKTGKYDLKLHSKKRKVADKMGGFKSKPQGKNEDDRAHWHRLEADFYNHGKDLPKGKPLSFYKGKI